MSDKCTAAGCSRPVVATGFCGLHRQRFMRRVQADRTFTAPPRATAPGELVSLTPRVRREVWDELAKAGATATTAAKDVLTAWAMRRLK